MLGLNLSARYRWRAELLAVAAVAVALIAVRPLVPRGTLTARRGLPSVILTRGLASAAFFGAEVYLPYLLVERYAFSPDLCWPDAHRRRRPWAAGSAVQGRLGTRLEHRSAVRIGSALVLGAVVLALVTTVLAWPAAVAIAAWMFAGGGMGLMYRAPERHDPGPLHQGHRGLQQLGDVHLGFTRRRAGPRRHGDRVRRVRDGGAVASFAASSR